MQNDNPSSAGQGDPGNDIAMKKLSDRIVTSMREYGRALAFASKFTKGLLVVVGAGLAGGGQFIQYGALGPIVGWIGVGLALVGGFWALAVDDSAPDMLVEAHEAVERARTAYANSIAKDQFIEDLRARLVTTADVYICSQQLREFVETQIAAGRSDVERSVRDMISLISRQLRALMKVISGEYWTLSVYRHVEAANGQSEGLVYIAGDRTERQGEAANHRVWGMGEGVAGHCLRIGRELIVENANDPDQVSWLHIPEALHRDHDPNKYRSFAALPIVISGRPVPWGVIVATSDRANCFATDGTGRGSVEIEPLRMFRGAVALLAVLSHLTDRLPPEGGGDISGSAT
ncbi:GAF domain-containing protein [Asticcacaulis solisilvae]|uniref:GAF domain-containing protein n=1 Tax=Asticcacaulis solisilvae TaxID=1217274 RepID=UPI003FD7D4D2